MFLSDINDFDYKPYVVDDEIQPGLVVNQSIITWQDERTGETYDVEEGFVCDLASMPWFVQWRYKKLGKHQRAAFLHDKFYREKTNGKAWADQQFLDAMHGDGMKTKAFGMWLGVHVGGWFAWRKKKTIIIAEV